MKTRQIVLVAFPATALLVRASLAVAAVDSGYSLDWFTGDGGGGTSSGGNDSVSGTIGQPDAGAFPDLTMTVELALAEGDPVAARWTTDGTNTGSAQRASETMGAAS